MMFQTIYSIFNEVMLKKIAVCFALAVWLVLLVFVWLLWQDYDYTRQTSASIRPAEVAVILSDDTSESCLSPVYAGIELYRAGKVQRLVMSGRYSQEMRVLAEKMGIPSAHLNHENQSVNIFENIVFSRRYIEGSRHVVLVGFGFHLPRAYRIAQKQWTQNIQIYASPFCTATAGYIGAVAREWVMLPKNGLQGRY